MVVLQLEVVLTIPEGSAVGGMLESMFYYGDWFCEVGQKIISDNFLDRVKRNI